MGRFKTQTTAGISSWLRTFFLGALFLLSLMAPVSAQTGAAEASRDALAARQAALLARMLEDPANLDIAFEHATVSAMLQDYEAAISTFERMLIFAPNLPRIQLELGVLYYRLGSLETARYYFQSALEAPNVPAEVQQKVETYLAAINAKERPTNFRASLAAGVRYQTNANAAPGGRSVSLNGRDFILDETATGQADFNVFAAGQAYGSYDLGTQGDLLEAEFLFFASRYGDLVRLDTGLAEVTAGPSFNLARFGIDDAQLGIYGIASGVRLNHANYTGALGVGARLVAQPDIQTSISSKVEFRQRWYNDTSENPTVSNRNGYYLRFASTISRQLTRSLRARVLALADFEEAKVNYQQSWEAGGGVGVTYRFKSPVKQLPYLWAFDVEAGYLYRKYDAPDPLISQTAVQHNHEGWARASLNVPVHYNFSVGLTSEFRRQQSNYDLSTYSNGSFMMTVSKQF